ncbi:TetR/AcrR family transcriptional regulator [Nonomuraea terrae]|uniref:TetR/AcrR family transcriptional regulator n=1 Tax=Nonomuraea terrae TaxID=2530383 RepID=A0A4R4YDK2_9ACTN|nr:TetR/AcrR family transcriptional regulator C-terminal domain-containing protein [Nonomuraea terrae]TDD41974.1 TetR/AcrR family transcriptional regulator [Nonomuraea terrae]
MAGDKVPSVWMRPGRQGREQPALNRAQIVAAALDLLDAQGVDALSMRKLGARLQAGATSLYTHVATKSELIELVVDEVYGEVEAPRTGDPDGWRAAVARCAASMRATILRHPWIVSVLGEAGVAYLGPNMSRLSEAMLAVFEEAGLSLEAADQAVNTVVAYVVGISASEAAWLATLARSGRSEREWAERLWPSAEHAVRDHPRLRALYAARRGRDPRGDRDGAFATGLDCVLQGLTARLAGQEANRV